MDIHNWIMDIHNCKPITNKAAIIETCAIFLDQDANLPMM